MKKKTAKQLERHFKGAANHYRIEILQIVARQEGVSLEGIVQATGGNVKTISEHTRRLALAGLINKKYQGKFVAHSLSPYGKKFLKFINSF